MKCWNLAFNAQGSRVNILLVEVGLKIYVAAVEALRKKEREDETQFTTKIGGKISLGPRLPIISFWKFSFPVKIWCPIMPKPAILGP